MTTIKIFKNNNWEDLTFNNDNKKMFITNEWLLLNNKSTGGETDDDIIQIDLNTQIYKNTDITVNVIVGNISNQNQNNL